MGIPNKTDGAFQLTYTVPGPVYFGTKTAIEALTGIQSGAFAIGYTTTLADGQFGFFDGAAWHWDTGGGGGTPGGSDTEIQVNDSGAFAGYSTFRRQANGAIVIGDIDEDITIEPYSIGQGADGSSIANFLESFGTGVASFIALLRARGTHDAPEAVQSGDVIGRIRGRAHDGSAWSNTQLEIRLVADGDWSAGDHPSRIEIYTTPDGTDTPTLAMTIGSDGNVNIASGKTYNINGSPHQHAASDITSGTIDAERLPLPTTYIFPAVPTTPHQFTRRKFLIDDVANNILGFETNASPYTPAAPFSAVKPASNHTYNSSKHHLEQRNWDATTHLYTRWTSATAKSAITINMAISPTALGSDYLVGAVRLWAVQSPGASDKYWEIRFKWMGSTYPQHPLMITSYYGTGVTFTLTDGTLIGAHFPLSPGEVYTFAMSLTAAPALFANASIAEGFIAYDTSSIQATYPTNFKEAWILTAAGGNFQRMYIDDINIT